MNPTRRHNRTLLAVGGAGAVILGAATTAGLAAAGGGVFPGARAFPSSSTATCDVPALPGTVVQVTLTDMGAMMGRPHGPGPMTDGHRWWPHMGMPGMMRVFATPAVVPPGTVSLQATNTGG